MTSPTWAVAAALAASLVSSTALAATCVGSCGVITGANGDVAAAPGGGAYTWISTNNGLDGAGQIGSVGGTNGSSLTTGAFTVSAGQLLAYDFNFVTSDGQDPGNRATGHIRAYPAIEKIPAIGLRPLRFGLPAP